MSTTLSAKVSGIFTAMVTPFDTTGAIDESAFEKILDRQLAAGIDGVVIYGTTGESPTLSESERAHLLRLAIKKAHGRMAVWAGVGTSDTHTTLAHSKLAIDCGADALLVVTPPYNRPSPRGIMQHYQAISQLKHPFCIYNVPTRTGTSLTFGDFKELLTLPHVCAVKEASGSMPLMTQLTACTNLPILSGDDESFLPSLAVGGQGIISVITNLWPELFVQMFKLWQSHEVKEARDLFQLAFPLIKAMSLEPNPVPVKAAMAYQKMIKDEFRLPLVPLADEPRARLHAILQETASDIHGKKGLSL